MAVPKAKKKKKPPMQKPTKTPLEIVKMANYVNLAALVRTLWMEYGWREKRTANFLEAHLALLSEVQTFGVWQMIKDTEELTGIDVQKLFDEICEDKA